VLLGNGDGTFQPKADYLESQNPSWSAIVDVDGDGRQDLLATGLTASHLAVLRRQGPPRVALRAGVDLDPNVLNNMSRGATVTAYLEPVGFAITDIDFSSIRLAGSLLSLSKLPKVGDHDGDNVPDVALQFSREALQAILFPGWNSVHLTGVLRSGVPFEGADDIRVISAGSPRAPSIAPNPLNPSGVLTFDTSAAGLVTVKLYDLQGRLVRTIAERPLPAGTHEIPVDARDLASGVYFFHIQSVDGPAAGRVAILK
jgi:hypothetical protein